MRKKQEPSTRLLLPFHCGFCCPPCEDSMLENSPRLVYDSLVTSHQLAPGETLRKGHTQTTGSSSRLRSDMPRQSHCSPQPRKGRLRSQSPSGTVTHLGKVFSPTWWRRLQLCLCIWTCCSQTHARSAGCRCCHGVFLGCSSHAQQGQPPQCSPTPLTHRLRQ